jgi:uncharacterized protein (DUF58 family)
MTRANLLGPLILILLLAGLATLHGGLLALSIPFFLYWVHGLWRGPDKLDLNVHRELSADRASPHMPVRVKLWVTNAGNGVEELALDDVISQGLAVADGNKHHLISLPRGGRFEFEYTVQGPRGAYTFEALHADATDHLGLKHLTKDLRAPGQLVIFPSIARIRHVPIRPRRTRVYAGTIPARVGGAGVEFFGVRDYEPGDPPRHINWRVSARQAQNLYSNEFQQERVADVGIVLDARERSNLFPGGHSLFEHSVLAAGAMADALLNQGNRVGLLVYSQYLQWTLPGYGRIQRQRILHALSQATPGSSQIFEGLQYLPARLFPPESQIVLISPLVEDDYSTLVQLRARGYQVMLVSPDPVAFEEARLPRGRAPYSKSEVHLAARILRMEREWMLRRVRRAGVHVIEWNVAQPFDQLARRSFGRSMRIGQAL